MCAASKKNYPTISVNAPSNLSGESIRLSPLRNARAETTALGYDTEKADELALALLYLASFEDHGGVRAWKGLNWNIMNRLHEKGLISDPKSKAKSVWLTDEETKRSRALFEKCLQGKS